MSKCPLCQNSSTPFYKDEFYQCSCCKGIFRPKEKLLNNELEKQRYESHTNDSDDLGYQNFAAVVVGAWDKQIDMEKFKYCLDHPETVKDVIPG